MTDEHSRYAGILVDEYDLLMRAWPHSKDMHSHLAWSEIGHHSGFYDKKEIKVLELGSGRGEFTKPILECSEKTRVTAVDKSPVMCSQLLGNLTDYVQNGRLVVMAGADAFEYLSSVPEGSYDVAASAWFFHNFTRKDRNGLLKLVHRAVSPGGIFVMMDKVLDDNPRQEQESLQKAIKSFEYLIKMGRKDVYDAIVAHEIQDHEEPFALRKDEFLNDLLRAGFVDTWQGMRDSEDPSRRDLVLGARKI